MSIRCWYFWKGFRLFVLFAVRKFANMFSKDALHDEDNIRKLIITFDLVFSFLEMGADSPNMITEPWSTLPDTVAPCLQSTTSTRSVCRPSSSPVTQMVSRHRVTWHTCKVVWPRHKWQHTWSTSPIGRTLISSCRLTLEIWSTNRSSRWWNNLQPNSLCRSVCFSLLFSTTCPSNCDLQCILYWYAFLFKHKSSFLKFTSTVNRFELEPKFVGTCTIWIFMSCIHEGHNLWQTL